ncbi:MAG TPA: MucB/RseB C-terminal domain-containing protein [Lamprocystis sp. (in: g-proteobacteria)]|nr:MucB/RseB C-terminal domain-containing protein [Lamprocystis sp. (in: g-proteobacteria)]
MKPVAKAGGGGGRDSRAGPDRTRCSRLSCAGSAGYAPWPEGYVPRALLLLRSTLARVLLGLLTVVAIPGEGATVTDPPPPGPEDLAPATRFLDRMNAALRSLDYQGTLVYLVDNRLETLQLVHRVEQGQVQERLVSLSGPPRTVTRGRDGVTCEMPDGRPLLVKGHARQHLTQARLIDPQALTEHYRIVLLGTARVAGREADVVLIRPLDEARYGFQFHLDRETGLPLKSDLINAQGEAIEQLLFTAIDVNADRAVVPGATPASAPLIAAGPADQSEPTPWRFEPRPAGFELAMHDVMEGPQGAPIDHFLFSDRLSAYSIYIEGNTANGLNGVTRIGAVHAAGRLVDGYQVTAVGEVPAATVQAAVLATRWVAPAAP